MLGRTKSPLYYVYRHKASREWWLTTVHVTDEEVWATYENIPMPATVDKTDPVAIRAYMKVYELINI